MRNPRQTLPISPELLRSSVDLEVSIGAYARRQRRRRWLIGIVGALLICGAAAVYWGLRQNAVDGATDYPVLVDCTKCGERSESRASFRQSYPVTCPKCRNKTAWPLLKCLKCEFLFVPNASAGEARCPRCKSTLVGSPMSATSAEKHTP